MKWIDVAKDPKVLTSQFQAMPVTESELLTLYKEFMADTGDKCFDVVKDPIKYVKLCAYLSVSKGKMPESMRKLGKRAIELSFMGTLIEEDIRKETTPEELHELIELAMQILEGETRLNIQQVSISKN